MSDRPAGPEEVQQIRTHQELDEKLTRARGIINALERSFRARKLYETDHPLRQEALAELLSRFEAFFDRYSYLRLDVTDSELRLAGKPLMKCEPRDPEVPFRMYKDGIREIRFHRGITKQEIMDFLSILDIDSKQLAEMDMDLVSIMWAKDFKAIDQITVDEIEMMEPDSSVTGDREAPKGARSPGTDLVRLLGVIHSGKTEGPSKDGHGGGAGGGGEETPSPGSPGAGSAAVLAGNVREISVPSRQTPTPYRPEEAGPAIDEAELETMFLTPVDPRLKELREEVERETLGAVIDRTLDILIDLFSPSERVLAEEVRPLLRGLVAFHARKGDFARLGHLVKRLDDKKFLGRVVGGEALWKELHEDLRAPEARKLFLTYLNTSFVGDVDGLKLYFTLVDAALVPDACALYGQIRSSRARGPVREYLILHGRKNPGLIKGLLTIPEALLPEALEIYRQVNPPGLPGELESAFAQLPRGVKLEGLSVAAKAEGPGRTRLFEKALLDPEAAVRAHALKLMGESRSADFRRLVQEWIDGKEFAARSPGEKLLGYCTLGRIAGAAGLTYLKELVERKPSLFDAQKVAETRRTAIQAVSSLETAESRRLLEAWAAHGDRQLRETASQALKSRG